MHIVLPNAFDLALPFNIDKTENAIHESHLRTTLFTYSCKNIIRKGSGPSSAVFADSNVFLSL